MCVRANRREAITGNLNETVSCKIKCIFHFVNEISVPAEKLNRKVIYKSDEASKFKAVFGIQLFIRKYTWNRMTCKHMSRLKSEEIRELQSFNLKKIHISFSILM